MSKTSLCGEFELHARCPDCDTGLPINGLREEVRCHGCGRGVDVRRVLTHVLSRFEGSVQGQVGGDLYVLRFNGGGKPLVTRVRAIERAPRCAGCGAALAHPAEPGTTTCAACGRRTAVLEAPESLRVAGSSALRVYCPEDTAAEPQSLAGAAPVHHRCPGCGADQLVTAATRRASPCAFCSAELILPDGLWEHFHPGRPALPFHVVFAGASSGYTLPRTPEKPDPDAPRRLALRRWAARQPVPPGGWEGVCFAFRVQVTCEHCSQQLGVNGPWSTAFCNNCHRDVDVRARVSRLVATAEEDDPPGPKGQRILAVNRGTENHLWWAQASPRCRRCERELPLQPAEFDGVIRCEGCGEGTSCFPVPGWLKESALAVVQCYGGERQADAGRTGLEVSLEQAGVVSVRCPGCRGGLALAGAARRICCCEHCAAEFWVPDEVWSRLHPPAPPVTWFLEYRGPIISLREQAAVVRSRGYF